MGRMIPKRQLDEIRFGNDIADVVGSYLTLKRAGGSFKALCPFHKEKTPSFHVNQQRQSFHCFGCGAGGDVFSFVMQYESVDFMTAARMLAQRAGVVLELEEGDVEDASVKEILYRIHQQAAEFYQRCLLQTESAGVAREYLKQRDLDKGIVEDFMIGYAPRRWDAVLKWSTKHKYARDHMEQAGLIMRAQNEKNRDSVYDRFRHRLMFPIRDEQSRIIGFSGRALEQDAKTAKYVNSPETPLFKKSRVLYALDKARRAILDTAEAVLCEGQIDVIRCHQAGLNTAVAAQGTALTDDHARVLKRYADSLCLVFDPDTAGQDAAMRTAGVLMDAGLAVRVASLPKGDDPDSFIRKRGADAFKAVLKEAKSAVAFQIDVLSTRYDLSSEVGVMRAAKRVLETVLHSPNAVQRAKMIQQAAERLNLPESALMDDLRFKMRHDRRRGFEAKPGDDATGNGKGEAGALTRPKEEVELCEHMVCLVDNPELAPLVEKYAPAHLFQDPDCRMISQACLASLPAGEELQATLRRSGGGESLLKFAAQIQMAPAKTTGKEFSREEAVKGLILRMWRRRFENERADLQRTKAPEGQAERDERRVQITYHLNRLRTWEEGAQVIEFELAG